MEELTLIEATKIVQDWCKTNIGRLICINYELQYARLSGNKEYWIFGIRYRSDIGEPERLKLFYVCIKTRLIDEVRTENG